MGVIPAENKQEIGIQRVQSWLYSKQLYFAYTALKTIEQFRAYRRADNTKPSGEKKVKEEVFKLKDELPDAVRYAVMAWPQLPAASREQDARTVDRMAAFDDRTRADIEAVRAFNRRDTQEDLQPVDEGYPLGGFYNPEAALY